MVTTTYKFLRIQAETVLAIVAGISALILDTSFITFSKDVDKLWKIALDPYKFPPITQMQLKYFLTMLVVVRTFTVHITIALYVVMLWPAVFAEREYLLIPWMVVGTIRLCADFMATLTGLYVCSKYGMVNTLWIEFLLVQTLQHGPFLYVWLTVVKYRFHLVEVQEEIRKEMEQEVYHIKRGGKSRQQITADRRRTFELKKDSISQTTITTIIQRLSDRKKENMSTRSLDTLLEIVEQKYPNKKQQDNINANEQTILMKKLQIIDQVSEQSKNNTNDNYINDGSVETDLIDSEFSTDLQCIYDETLAGSTSQISSESETDNISLRISTDITSNGSETKEDPS